MTIESTRSTEPLKYPAIIPIEPPMTSPTTMLTVARVIESLAP